MSTCPKCSSANCVKNGTIHNKKPKMMCKDCGRQFVKERIKTEITEEKRLNSQFKWMSCGHL